MFSKDGSSKHDVTELLVFHWLEQEAMCLENKINALIVIVRSYHNLSIDNSNGYL